MKSDYDVIVIGAGPAGSVAATTAARQGMDVLLLEKRQEIGEPVRCAEGVFKEGLDDFIEYDPRWVCADITKARVYAPDGSYLCFSEKSGASVGYVLDRKIFDRALAKQAADAGSEIQVKAAAKGLIMENGRVAGVKGICRGVEFEARSKIVIGADGVESKVARWAGLMGPIQLKDIETCAEFLVSNVDIDPQSLVFYFSNVLCPGGYVWIFPKGQSEANIGLGILGARFDGTHPIEYLKRFVDSRFPDARIVQTMVGAVPVCDRTDRISTGGLMLAGDSARLVDPLLGAGIMNAMVSGRMAANRAVEAISSGDLSSKALMQYDNEITQMMGRSIRRNYKAKEMVVKASDRQMNVIFGSLRRTNVENIPVSSIYHTITSSGIPILQMMRVFL